jgi:hypothetical protein
VIDTIKPHPDSDPPSGGGRGLSSMFRLHHNDPLYFRGKLELVWRDGGMTRARSHCHVVRPLIFFMQDSLTYSVGLFLKRQCDLGNPRNDATVRPHAKVPAAERWGGGGRCG